MVAAVAMGGAAALGGGGEIERRSRLIMKDGESNWLWAVVYLFGGQVVAGVHAHTFTCAMLPDTLQLQMAHSGIGE
jgi:hypothetical protein